MIGRLAGMAPPATGSSGGSPTDDPVVGRDGSQYPAEFGADLVWVMPPRVRRGANYSEMVGYITVDRRDLGRVGASRSDPWVEDVTRRLRSLRQYGYLWLAHHVEMKAVAMLLRLGGSHAEVRINHAPCGSEPRQGSGCHQLLPDFLPTGTSITVLGTDSTGRPFHRTYEGRARR